MGNNMVPYAILIGEKYAYIMAHHYMFTENDKVEEGTLLIWPDPIAYHIEKCGIDSFKKLENNLIHTYWPGQGEDIESENDIPDVEDEFEEDDDLIETQNVNGNNEVVKVFNQKCVLCYDKDSVYAFRQCGHQCNCED